MKGAPECMRISGFMHGVNNPELTKRLNKHVPKTMEEMMITTTAFIRGEVAAAGKKKGHTSWRTHDQSKRHTSERRFDFRGHSTDECMQLKKQIEELVRAGKLSHLIKEIKQGRDQPKVGKKEVPAKDKSMAIYMIQPWHRMTRQKVTQSFERVSEITFPSLTTSSGTEGPLVIEAEIGGHMIHRMYADGGGSNQRDAIHKRTDRTIFTPEEKLEYIRMESVGHDRSTAINKGTSTQYLGRIFARSIEEKGPGPRACESHPSGVMVKKHDGSWRMYVDFTDLNKACPQDCYPLQEIDWKVESLCGYPFKCFLDAYKGYHQIHMAESDEEKTAFHTSQGVYCYTKMPFGFKNVGTTYQWLVDKAFDSQVGQNIEVYVDDLVIKSHTEAKMIRDIDETFKVQSLNGKLASLNRFLSKSAKKSLPLFKTLKKCIKKSDLHWTPDAEQAFKQLKQHLSELPLLVAPKPKEKLIVYMSATHGAISTVLMTERGTVQNPIYFVSRALQGLELNYTPMEKLVLSLVFAAKRLR
ncbi:reverse transcriptase domain-containing protein, partial [Tanacetum coccineum]